MTRSDVLEGIHLFNIRFSHWFNVMAQHIFLFEQCILICRLCCYFRLPALRSPPHRDTGTERPRSRTLSSGRREERNRTARREESQGSSRHSRERRERVSPRSGDRRLAPTSAYDDPGSQYGARDQRRLSAPSGVPPLGASAGADRSSAINMLVGLSTMLG